MNKEKKHILTLFVAVIIVSATIATAVPMAMNYYEDKDEEGKTLFVKAFVDLKEGIAPHSVNFTSIVMNSEGDVEYLWDFGDGETSNLKNPNHTYIENNTYICNLTAKDSSGAEATNSIAIYAIENRKPTVSIEKPTPNARRPLVIWYEFIPKQLRFDTYTGSDYWFLRDKSLLPKSFTSKPGFYTVTASANDLDGDEIVNYTWILNPPEHTNRKNQVQRLEFVYYGQTITFPIEDIYPSIDYDLKCIVTDSAGQTGEANEKFKTLKSFQKDEIESLQKQIENFKIKTFRDLAPPSVLNQLKNGAYDIFDILDNSNFPITAALVKSLLAFIIVDWTILPSEELGENIINSIIPILKRFDFLGNNVDGILLKLKDFNQNRYNNTDDPNKKQRILGIIDNIELLRERLQLGNIRPVIENPIPIQGSENLPINMTKFVRIYINDLHLNDTGAVTPGENNTFNVTIYDLDGYVENKTWSDVKTGWFETNLTGLPEFSTIKWNVKVVDFEGDEVHSTFQFSTYR